MNKTETASIDGSAGRAAQDGLALYRYLQTQGRPDLERLAWVVYHESSESAEALSRVGTLNGAAELAILDSAEKAEHIALSLYDLLTASRLHEGAETAIRIYHEARSSAEAMPSTPPGSPAGAWTGPKYGSRALSTPDQANPSAPGPGGFGSIGKGSGIVIN